MKVLIIGNGGREHALAWKVASSDKVAHVYVAPGNAGTETEPKLSNVEINVADIPALIEFAQTQAIDLTIVGPEAPLVLGVVDAFSQQGLACFGPSQGAAQLEGSKAFSKEFLSKYNIPTAAFETFTDADAACAYICEQGAPIVVKADGLAAGKGVVVASTVEEAQAAVRDMLLANKFGDAGARVVVEEFLQGEEASFICMVDGHSALPLATSQDHKARDNGDQGPNTGGMGAYSPAPVVDEALHQRIMDEVINPTIEGMAQEGYPYMGFLYAGIMVTPDGTPKVLEYNCRFGDPETQPIMMRLKSDLTELCFSALEQRLDQIEVDWDERAALGVVLAADGYPNSYHKDIPLIGLDALNSDSVKVFEAGTAIKAGEKVSSGGRVVCVTALGANVSEAQKNAYTAIGELNCPGLFWRTDIGYRAVNRER